MGRRSSEKLVLERSQFTLTNYLKEALIGLLLGDLYARKRHLNTHLVFKQGVIHKEYLDHLYELFQSFCMAEPKISKDKSVRFHTRALPCFNEIYDFFYFEGKKVVPGNIGELLTPVGLAFLISDDGTFSKINGTVTLCVESFSQSDVESLMAVLKNKFGLECRIEKRSKIYFRIVIKRSSLVRLREIVFPHFHNSMLYKLGL
jgi:LAGLIDADG DNA endonuclease family protein